MVLNSNYWQAVLTRDSSQAFVYAVTSTGIYCLPSCPSRRPKKENTAFYTLPELAEQAGYRACKRCKPEQNFSQDPQLGLIRDMCTFIKVHSSQSLTLQDLAEQFDLSSSHLQKRFKQIVGISPQVYLEALRLNNLKNALQEGDDILGAVYDAAYSSSAQLYSKAKNHLGMTPKTYKNKGASMLIHYSISACPLGQLLVAASDQGLCAVRLADDAQTLKETLFSEFAEATLKQDDGSLLPHVQQIIKHLEGKEPHLDLPLDVQATAFQRQVWQALQKIPYGETRSYAQVALSMGKPKAVRAVASACAKNPVALVVPCHRVIRTDGSMGGYRWGIKRKESLLATELEHKHISPKSTSP